MIWLVLALILLLLVGFQIWRRLMLGRLATAVADDNPLMLSAFQQARSTLSEVATLLSRGEEVAVKFPLSNAEGKVEHVWGLVHQCGDKGFEVEVVTPLLVGQSPEGRLSVGRDEVEDWQAFLADGSGIRGGYSTQAQLEICRQLKLPIPRALEQQDTQFLDTFVHPTKQTT